MSAAFEDIATTLMDLMELYELDPDVVRDMNETLLAVYASHLVGARGARRG